MIQPFGIQSRPYYWGVSSFQLRQYYTSRYVFLAQHRSLLNNHVSIDTSILQKIEVTPFWLNPDDIVI